MANIIVTATPTDLNVTTTQSNITVTDLETNVSVNVASLDSAITVTNAVSNIIVGVATGVSNIEIRSALSAVSPILYDVSNGIISFDSNASFAGKTTDDLAQGVTNIYFSTSGGAVNTTNLPEGTNQYFTNARVLSAILDSNVKLKQYSETVVDSGTLNGNISLNAAQGTLFYGTINGNITGISISNFNEGSSLTLVLTQDGVGNNNLDTTTYTSNWSNWYFINDESSLSLTAASKSYITLIKVNGVINAAVVGGEPSLENYVPVNRQLFDNDIVTLAQGPFGGYYSNTNLAFGNAYLNTTSGDGSQRFLQSYNNDTGQWVTSDDGAISGLTVVDTGNEEGVVFGRFNPYSATPLSTTRALIALKGSDTLDIADLTANSTIRPAISFSTKVDGTTTFNNLKLSLGDPAGTERFGVEDTATLGAARFIGNVLIQNSNNQTNTTFKFGNIDSAMFQLDYGVSNAITARAAFSSNSNITTSANVQGNYLIGNGSLITGIASNAGVVSYIATQPLTVGGNLTVNGNINATGNINVQNVEDLYVRDQTIVMNANAASPANVQIVSNRPGFANTELKWNEQTDRWTFTNDGTTYYNLPTSTTDVAEGANLYYTTDRANTAIGAYQGAINTAGNITTSANVQGNYLLGNGAFITGLAGSGTVTQIDTGENLTGGPITSTGTIGMANSLANVNSITATLGQNHALISDTTLLQGRVRNNSVVNAANVDGLGFAIYDQTTAYVTSPSYPFITYSGTNELKQLVFDGVSTAGSNVITITNIYDAAGNTMAVSNVKQYYGFSEYPGAFSESVSFPEGTYVTSVSGSNVYMSANALTSTTFYADLSVTGYSIGCFFPMAYDTVTGFGLGFESAYDAALFGYPAGSAQTISLTATNRSSPLYAYPESGPAKADFTFPYDTANFSVASFSGTTLAKTNIGASKTVPAFTRGITVGAGDLTSRGIGDKLNPTFGLNILWDGTANVTQEYASPAGIFPQILLRSFSDGTAQGISGNTAASWSSGGPRLLFINGNGNANTPILNTYALANQELGKIGWTSTTAINAIPSSLGPAAYITAISNKNQTTGPGDVGLYLVASPTTSGTSTNQIGSSTARALFLAHHKANTIVSAGSRTNGTAGDIYFAPARQASNEGNAILLSERIVTSSFGSPHWAKIGYDNPASNTGAKVSVTNGFNTTSARNGNITLVLDRNDNGAGFGSKEWALKLRSGQTDLVLTEDDVIRTTFAGANITTAGNISAGNTVVNGVTFNSGTTAPTSGQIRYNSNYGTFQAGLEGANVINIGQDLVVYGNNAEANTLLRGEVVYISGATGDKASFRRAVNSSDANSATTIGIVKNDIVAGGLGYVVSQGVVDGLNLGTYTDGDKLYLGNVAGTFTNIKPSAPEHYVFIGVVEKANAGNGQVLVRVQNGFELDEIHDIKLTSVQQNDMLIRNSSNTLWVNQSVSSVVANSNITLKQFSETKVALGNVTGDISSNINVANGTIYTMTATGNITINSLANVSTGTSATLIITQDGTGGKTLTSTMKFAGGSKTLSTAANAIDIISVFYDGTTYYAALSKGYA